MMPHGLRLMLTTGSAESSRGRRYQMMSPALKLMMIKLPEDNLSYEAQPTVETFFEEIQIRRAITEEALLC